MMAASACAFGAGRTALAAGAGGDPGPRRFVFMRAANGLWPKKLVPPTLPDDLKKKEENQEAFEVGIDQHELT